LFLNKCYIIKVSRRAGKQSARGWKMGELTHTGYTTDYLFPIDTVIKVVDGKRGRTYYKGSSKCFRFFPLSKASLEKLNLSEFDVFQEIISGEWTKIN